MITANQSYVKDAMKHSTNCTKNQSLERKYKRNK